MMTKNKAIHVAGSKRRVVVRPSQRTLARQRLTDHIKPGVQVLFVGINPGLRSAATGHHFAGHSNRFWKLLFESKLVPKPLTHQDDWRLPDWGLGLTNIIQRPSAGIDTLKSQEYVAGRKRLIATVKHYRPRAVALLGITIYRLLFPDYRTGQIVLGLQAKTLAGRPLLVLPNPSGRNAHYSYPTMLAAFRALRNATTKPLIGETKGTIAVRRPSQM
ncbi:MAG TPA: mismatch-specific DNA-glycosylase [Nitrospiraceae bacterium]|jgi:TDG/mug DNA glycosylase family protein|nr:mismatch-specific DNA-glycosylase [Nitrospiraceae bacterium]